MIIYQEQNPNTWFSWNSITTKHYYPKMDYHVFGPTKWSLEHNLKNGSSLLGSNVIGWW